MNQEKSVLPKYSFGLKGAVCLIAGAFFAISFLATINVTSMYFFKENFQYTDTFLVLSNALMWVGAIFAFDYLCCRPETKKNLNFNFSSENFFTYLLIFPMMFGMMLISESITNLIPISGPFFGGMYEFYSQFLNQLTEDTSVMILMAVIMAPIFEEIVFRGIIMKGMINKGVKPMTAIWISAIVFGFVHGNPWQFVGAASLGFVLGIVYYKTKSLLLPMLLHGFNNLVSTILIKYTDSESFSLAFHVPEWVIFVGGVILFSIFYYLFTKKYKVLYAE